MNEYTDIVAILDTTKFVATDIAAILLATKFAADKHQGQRRKGKPSVPYINHPIDVANILWNTGGVRDVEVIVAALLHDTVEDTTATLEEIENLFGARVASIVQEVSDDKSLDKDERKRLQVVHAPHLSSDAKLVKLADKISNVSDLPSMPWPERRKLEYVAWSAAVWVGLFGNNKALDDLFSATAEQTGKTLNEDYNNG